MTKGITNFIKEGLVDMMKINETDHIRCEIEESGYQFAEIAVYVIAKGKKKPYTFYHITLDTFRKQFKVY